MFIRLTNKFRLLKMRKFLNVLLCFTLFGVTRTLTALQQKNDIRVLCECGSSSANSIQTRVVGGKNAHRGTFPYAIGLFQYDYSFGGRLFPDMSPYCGATLISDRHVLTAAHCVRNRYPEEIELDIGDYDLSKSKFKSIERLAKNFIKHPQYVVNTHRNDIAIIEFSRPVILNSKLKAAWLPPPNHELAPGTQVTVYGWGRLSYGGIRPKVLQELNIPIMNRKQCQKRFFSRITSNMLCAGGEEGKDACIGDSGSGLTVRLNNENVLAGIVSFGKRCALPGVAGVYTKVSSFIDWIYENTKNAPCQPCISSREYF